MSSVLERLDRLEAEVRRIQAEIASLRLEAAAAEAPAQMRPPAPMWPPATPAQQPPPQRTAILAPPPPPSARREPKPPRPPRWNSESMRKRLEAADLLGARGLALTGGLVTLLGVVFFFALAASNGWIGPVERVLLGAAASAIVFAAGVLAHARYGRLDAAVAAAGAGIAGGYATLLFAAARYELVPPLGALALAAGIAALAVALSLRWSSEIVAAFGLIGAMCVPAVALIDDEATATGTTFVALVFLGAAAVGIWRRWTALLLAAGAVSVPQLLVFVYDEGEPSRWSGLAVAALFGLLYLGTGIARQLRGADVRLDAIASLYAGGNVALTLFSAFVLLDGDARAVGLAAAGLAYLAVAAVGWRREPELASLAVAAGSALVAVALAQYLDGPALVVAWAAETAVLAWLGRRLAETRFQFLGLAYLLLALAYALVEEAEPDTLFTRGVDHIAGVPALLAVAAGAAVYGWLARSWPAPRGLEVMPKLLRGWVEELHGSKRELSFGSLALAALVAGDAASLSILELFDRLGIDPSFDWGHVAVTGAWSLIALGLLAAGLALRAQLLEIVGLVTLTTVCTSFALFTIPELPHVSGWASLVVAGAGAAAGLVYGLLGGRLLMITAGAVAVGAVASGFASFKLLEEDLHGYGLLGAASAHLLIAAIVWRRRDLATFFWGAAAVLAPVGAALLLEDTWLVLALAGGGAAAAALGRLLSEPRLWPPAVTAVALAAVYTVAELAEPADFVRSERVPADGVPAVGLVAAALVGVLLSLRRISARDEVDRWIDERIGSFETLGRWSVGGAVLYGASLGILGIAEALSNAPETTELQRGHTAVSAFWGVLAFSAVVVGLRRGLRVVRLAGLGLFALALGKLFLYDLASLSSVTRALSFLAVGAVLLLAGFFYQRLSSEAPVA
jgi:uncharacterized membrane protein